ncbi:MAG: hypothetical protein ABIL39_11680 [candidate division WOR-3 bacterium]
MIWFMGVAAIMVSGHSFMRKNTINLKPMTIPASIPYNYEPKPFLDILCVNPRQSAGSTK